MKYDGRDTRRETHDPEIKPPREDRWWISCPTSTEFRETRWSEEFSTRDSPWRRSSLALWIAAIPVVNFDFRSEDELSFPSQSPWENERAVSLGSPVERANFSIPWRWSAIIEPVETSQTQDIKSRLRSRTSDSRFDSRPRMVHYPIVIGRLDTVPPRAKTLAANKLAAIAKRSIDSPVF